MMKQKNGLAGAIFWWVAGIVFVVLYLYTDLIFDHYKLSFASHMYKVAPWKTEAWGEKGPIFTDLEDSEYPALYSLYQEEDGFSLWDNKVALGKPTSLSYVLYPLNYLYWLPMDLAVLIKATLEFLIAFLGVFVLLKGYGCRNLSSAVAGLCYAFSATMVMWLGWGHSDVVAFAPFAFYLTERLIVSPKIRHGIGLSVVIFLMLVAGMPTFAAYFMYLLGVYLLWRTVLIYRREIKKIVRSFLMFGVFVAVGILMSFPYTISLLTSVGENGYAASRANMAFQSLEWKFIRTMLLPYFREGLNQHMNETTLYCGVLPVLLFPLAFVRCRENRVKRFFGVASVLIILLIFTHWFDKGFSMLPMINTSIKFRVVTLLMFTMTVTAGLCLDDILQNPSVYRRKIYLLYGIFIWGAAIISAVSKKLLKMTPKQLKKLELYDAGSYDKLLIMFFAVIITLMLYVLLEKRLFIIVLTGFVIFDMTGFARRYLPLIHENATVIPEATDSITYLQEHTKDYQRIAGIGGWDYMANSNVYYGLYDVRTHDFVATNPDMTEYYKRIYRFCYMSPTRIAFLKIGNYNLLKYLGTRYLVGENASYVKIYTSKKDLFGDTNALPPGTVLRQQLELEGQDLYACQILAGTNATVFTQHHSIKAFLVDRHSDVRVAEATVKPKNIKENDFFRIVFGHVRLSSHRQYDLVIELPENFEEQLTLFTTAGSEDGNRLTINGRRFPGHVIMKLEYMGGDLIEEYSSREGMKIAEFPEYAPKAALMDHIVVRDSKEEVLDYMKKEYHTGTVVLSKEEADEQFVSRPLSEKEQVELLCYRDDYMKIGYTSEIDRYMVISDYYDDDWKAYVNGKEVKLIRADYLLRAVEVPAGEDMVLELRYEPKLVYVTCVIAAGGVLFLLAVAVFSGRLSRKWLS